MPKTALSWFAGGMSDAQDDDGLAKFGCGFALFGLALLAAGIWGLAR